jgi:hypothetical protein
MKNFILWRYERGSWQYDVFCLLIIAFIFITPKAWFDKREKLATQTSRLIVKAKDFSSAGGERTKRVRELSGNPNAEILEWRETKNADGEIIYEIELR